MSGATEWVVMVRPSFASEFHEEGVHEDKASAEWEAEEWRNGGCDVEVRERAAATEGGEP